MRLLLLVASVVLGALLLPSAAPIEAAVVGPRIVTSGPQCVCVVGAEHTHVFIAEAASDGPFEWAVVDGELAPGKRLEFDGLTAMVRGAATEAGTYNFTLAVWDVNQPEMRAEHAYSVDLLPREYSPSVSDRVSHSLPSWFPIAAGVAVALSFFPLLRRRRSPGVCP